MTKDLSEVTNKAAQEKRLKEFADKLEALQKEYNFKLIAQLRVSTSGIAPIIEAIDTQNAA